MIIARQDKRPVVRLGLIHADVPYGLLAAIDTTQPDGVPIDVAGDPHTKCLGIRLRRGSRDRGRPERRGKPASHLVPGPQVLRCPIKRRVVGRDPPHERHAARPRHREHVAVRSRRPSVRDQRAVGPMESDELLQLVEERHSSTAKGGMASGSFQSACRQRGPQGLTESPQQTAGRERAACLGLAFPAIPKH